MNPLEYSESQKKDIEDRVAQANAALSNLDLRVQASMAAANVGDDIFGIKVVPYLQDTKYQSTESPIQLEDLG